MAARSASPSAPKASPPVPSVSITESPDLPPRSLASLASDRKPIAAPGTQTQIPSNIIKALQQKSTAVPKEAHEFQYVIMDDGQKVSTTNRYVPGTSLVATG
jgi:hypothetical protein